MKMRITGLHESVQGTVITADVRLLFGLLTFRYEFVACDKKLYQDAWFWRNVANWQLVDERVASFLDQYKKNPARSWREIRIF